MLDRLLRLSLQNFMKRGALRVTTADGATFDCGDGAQPRVAVRFVTRKAQWRLLFDPELAFGELYTEGLLCIDQGSLIELLDLVMSQPHLAVPGWAAPQWMLRYVARRIEQFNPRRRARRNVAHHYNLDGRLYQLFLDSDRQYSCAYFETPETSLDDAQLAKKRRLAAKLLIAPGANVLDIGSGWGGLAIYLSEVAKAHVTGITLSEEQLAVARMRAAEKHVAASFKLLDYRDVEGPFDRIVSVGMFEHVGVDHYDTFFRHCARLLADDGILLLHAIGRSEGPGYTNPWIAKYIFPGGYCPALSEVLPAIERAGLLVTDIEILRLHYAETLKAWRERFLAHREQAEQLYDARFVRMWEFYLAISEMSFRRQASMVFQIQLVKQQGIVPITRDYIGREEARLRRAENDSRPRLQVAGE